MGREAQIQGRSKENWVEAGLLQYRIDGLADYQRNYPEIVQQGYLATVVGQAGPDWTVFCRGRAIQLEVKTWRARDTHLLTWVGGKRQQRIRIQFETILQNAQVGGCLAFYLVCWRWHRYGVEWRLYPVTEIPVEDRGLRFLRKDGKLAHCDEYPDWLPIAFSILLRQTEQG